MSFSLSTLLLFLLLSHSALPAPPEMTITSMNLREVPGEESSIIVVGMPNGKIGVFNVTQFVDAMSRHNESLKDALQDITPLYTTRR